MSDKSTPFVVVPFNPLVNEPDEQKVEEEKTFIRERILNRANEDLVYDRPAMDELRALGSDLNINAFACNFRINGQINTDVEEANYLNSRIFQASSITKVDQPPADTPFFLSATTLEMGAYGDCAINFKKRMGLETDSHQDLFVLRNVVMSPFQTTGNFVQQLADTFKQTLEREMQVFPFFHINPFAIMILLRLLLTEIPSNLISTASHSKAPTSFTLSITQHFTTQTAAVSSLFQAPSRTTMNGRRISRRNAKTPLKFTL